MTTPSPARRRRPSPTLVVALIALPLATAGTSYAAGALAPNSVGTAQLRAKSVTVAKLAPSTIGRLSGKPGPRGPAGATAPTVLGAGKTARGTWIVQGDSTAMAFADVSFAALAPTAVDSRHVVVSFEDTDRVIGDGCTGTAAAPVAAKGFVCVYLLSQSTGKQSTGLGALSDLNAVDGQATGDGARTGFYIGITGNGAHFANGTWAYTAP